MLKSLNSLLFVVASLVFPFLITSPYYLHIITIIAIYAILLLGLDIVFGYTGEVSLGHSALFGVGAYAAGVMVHQGWLVGGTTSNGIDFLIAIPLGIALAAFAGALLALPALRVTGPYLAMVTLAFGTILAIQFNERDLITNGAQGIRMTLPLFFDFRPLTDQFVDALPFLKMSTKRLKEVELYFVCMLFLGLSIIFVNRIIASRFGRAFEALRDSPIASDCMGVSVYNHKVLAFVISAGMAGLAGVLFAYADQYIAPNNFSFELTVQFMLAVAMGGRKSRLGPILGAIIIVYLPNLLADIDLFRIVAGIVAVTAVIAGAWALLKKPEDPWAIIVPVGLCIAFFIFALLLNKITDFKNTIYGAMILFVVFYLPDGIVGFLKRAFAEVLPSFGRAKARIDTKGDEAHIFAAKSVAGAGAGAPAALLDAKGIVMQFGGLKALDRVDLSVRTNRIHGLIGPNGSGKSTMMNVLTGIYVPTGGEVDFQGVNLAGMKSPEIAGRGVARTFQNVQLFGELSVIENVMVGLHHTYQASLADVAFKTSRARKEETAAEVRAASILQFVGLADLANEEARNLPYGRQRLLEIGRALALDPKLLLLDEPAAGLTAPDIKELIEIIRKIRDHGIAVLLIEHHMDVVMGICDKVTVLDFGQKIAEGTPAEVQANPKVIEAYLGGAGTTETPAGAAMTGAAHA